MCLGVIIGVHGVKGDVCVKTFTQNPLDIGIYGALFDKQKERKFDIQYVKQDKAGARLSLKGVTSRTQAESLKGTELYVEQSCLPILPEEDDFYYADLVGLDAISPEGVKIGKVEYVHNFGAEDLLAIADMLIPFRKIYVPEVNIEQKYLTIILPSIEEIEEKP